MDSIKNNKSQKNIDFLPFVTREVAEYKSDIWEIIPSKATWQFYQNNFDCLIQMILVSSSDQQKKVCFFFASLPQIFCLGWIGNKSGVVLINII